METDWLRDFLALAEQATFSRAADARHITQPAFSRRIRALEDWIGAPLFVRSAHGATVTPAGAHFKPMAEDLVRTLDRARREIRRVDEREAGSLSIAATHALSFTFVPAWIRRHIALDALGSVNLISNSMDACEQVLLSGEVHFLLCHHHHAAPARFDPTRFPSHRIGSETLVAVCAPDAQLQPLWPLDTPRTLPTHLLGYSPASGLGRILAAQPQYQSWRESTETVFTSHLAATLLRMALDGQGAAWLPNSLIEDHLRDGQLVRAAPETTDVRIEIRLFRSPDCRNVAADRIWRQLSD